ELRAELRRFSWSHGHTSASRIPLAAADVTSTAIETQNGYARSSFALALVAQALGRERAQNALRALKFISTKAKGIYSNMLKEFL
ncbi:respiratory burst oxidase homolog protein A, partial [Fagus crenata]